MCISFCHTAKWISYTFTSSALGFPSHLGHHRALSSSLSTFSLVTYFDLNRSTKILWLRYIYGWFLLLSTSDYENIVNRLYSNREKVLKKKKFSSSTAGFCGCCHTRLCFNQIIVKWVWLSAGKKAGSSWPLIRVNQDMEQNFKWGPSLGTKSLKESWQEKTNAGFGQTIATVESSTVIRR